MRWTNPRIVDPITLAATSSTRAAASSRIWMNALRINRRPLQKIWHVGQITGISSSSQALSPRLESGRGLFESELEPFARAKRIWHVGQITGISTTSQELSPRREAGRGLFESDGAQYFMAPHPSHVSAMSQDASQASCRTSLLQLSNISSENRFPLFRIILY